MAEGEAAGQSSEVKAQQYGTSGWGTGTLKVVVITLAFPLREETTENLTV